MDKFSGATLLVSEGAGEVRIIHALFVIHIRSSRLREGSGLDEC